MKNILIIMVALMAATPSWSACYADYKAKQDNPLRLHYGVAQVPDDACSPDTAQAVLAPRLMADGWQLLNVVSVFDETGLEGRRAAAGEFYLRY